MDETRTTCCYCGVGCGVIVESTNGRITGVRGDPDHPANFGRLCTKGSTLHLTARHDLRAQFPEARASRNDRRTRVGWDAALDLVAARFAQTIREHGPDSVAFYISGQLLTEDYYVFNKLAKGLVGTNNVDTNSRLCMSSAVAGYKASLGADAPPACYEDIDHAACLFISGSNTAFAHPIVFRRIEDARARHPDLKIVVVDPRRTDTAAMADLHLAIAPGTDVALHHAMLHVLLSERLVDRAYIDAHTSGFAALEAAVAAFDPATVAGLCGVTAPDVVRAARLFAAGPTLSLYCQGLNQSHHGTDNNTSLINLHLATGQIGRPGAGPFSLTGQPNAMGGREVGGMANLLSAHRDLANPAHRDEVAGFWGVASVPAKPGRTAVELFDAIHTGEIRAVWIACTNPAQSMPDVGRVRAALERAEFVIVQEAYRNTDTAAYADVLLPASSWGEKEGTVTNSERRISRVRAAVAAPGEARADWRIARDFALRLGAMLGDDRAARLFAYDTPEAVFDEHRESTRARDLDITGLSYAKLERDGPQQWPLPESAVSGVPRLYADGRYPTPDGRARFVVSSHRGTAERVDAAHPLHLLTGRLRDQWHGMSRTGTVGRLFAHEPEPMVTLHPADAGARSVAAGDLVRLSSRRGTSVLRAALSDELQRGHAFVPMHWGSQFVSGAGANALTIAAVDPTSFQPELKHAAVEVARVDLPWRIAVLRRIEPGTGLQPLRYAQSLLARFPFATATLAGRDGEVLRFQAADRSAPANDLLQHVDRLFGLDEPKRAIDYRDARREVERRIVVRDDVVVAVRLAGDVSGIDALESLMVDARGVGSLRRYLAAPWFIVQAAGLGVRGRTVCACHDVAESTLRRAIADGCDVAALSARFGCGTGCGSCVPELRRMVAAAVAGTPSRTEPVAA
jgi:assimilatory nitrate reductase catalytic subunit